ncbi:hypothetical protein L6R49_29525 [Myxococcota bacterium]|nr:hypothetical protein [Myxococcota bacterium]
MSRTALALLAALALAVIVTGPALWAGDAALVGRHFDLHGTVWFLSAAPRIDASLTDPLTAWPDGASLRRADSWTLLLLGRIFAGSSAVALHNVLQPLAVASGALAMWALARAEGVSARWSSLAALTWAGAGLTSTALLEGHVYQLLNFSLPLLAWSWRRATSPDGRAAHGLAAGLCFTVALATSAYTGVAAAILTLTILACAVATARPRLAPLAAAAVALPAGLVYLSVFRDGRAIDGLRFVSRGFESRAAMLQAGSADLVTLAAPSPALDLFGHSQSSFLSPTALALCLAAPLALRGARGWGPWLGLVVVGLLTSMGPSLSDGDGALLPLPMSLLTELPAAELLRFPARLGWVTVIGLGVLAAKVGEALERRAGRRAWALFAFALIDCVVWGGMPWRQRGETAAAPSAYAGRGAIFDLYPESPDPTDEWNQRLSAFACFYQSRHGRPIADDCVAPSWSQNPRAAKQAALTEALLAGGDGLTLLRAWGFEAVAFHPDLFSPGDRARLSAALGALDAKPAESRDGGEHIIVYRVPTP